MRIRAIDLRAVPLLAAVVPLVTVNVCYLVSVSMDHVPGCIPYITGCTSVSSTGRVAPESLIFRAGMLPSAVLLAVFWFRCSTFLELGRRSASWLGALRLLGVVAAVSLMIYALTLGYSDDGYRQLRRAGIFGFATSTFAAEVLLIFCYRPMRIAATTKHWRWLVLLCVALPLLGIASELAKWSGAPRHGANNTVAWNAFLAASAFYAVVARIWWHHGFRGEYRLELSGSSDFRSRNIER